MVVPTPPTTIRLPGGASAIRHTAIFRTGDRSPPPRRAFLAILPFPSSDITPDPVPGHPDWIPMKGPRSCSPLEQHRTRLCPGELRKVHQRCRSPCTLRSEPGIPRGSRRINRYRARPPPSCAVDPQRGDPLVPPDPGLPGSTRRTRPVLQLKLSQCNSTLLE